LTETSTSSSDAGGLGSRYGQSSPKSSMSTWRMNASTDTADWIVYVDAFIGTSTSTPDGSSDGSSDARIDTLVSDSSLVQSQTRLRPSFHTV